MRFYVLCGLLLSLAVTCSGIDPPNLTPTHDGQPGCGIRYEFRRLWRNNFIPEQYWECKQWNHPAEVRHCPSATRFQDSWQTCVPFNLWEWTPFSDPPTKPFEDHEECQEIVQEPPTGCPDGSETEPIGICPGASDAQHNPGMMSCRKPQCTEEQWIKGTLFPSRDPTHFYQCGPGGNNTFLMPCAKGTCFSYTEQVCVHAALWSNDCA